MKPTPTHHQEPLMVALRVRPMNSSENKAGAKQIAFAVDKHLVVLMDPNDDNDDILRANRSREKKYIFDQTFNQHSTQSDIYDATVKAKSMVERVLNGYNCTVFAYGATGAGKTHTMLGTVREPGIMMLTLNDLYTKIEETKDEMTYRVSMAYVEIYNETVRDLLKGGQVLDLRDDSKGEVTISGLLDLETHSTSDIMALLSRGNQLRTSEPTAANNTSSRSHALLKVSVEQRSKTMNVKQEVKSSVLFMVDLAGSERAAVTQNRGMRMIEGAHINRSLLALANCINALTTGHSHFVNYRDSKLTRLLKEALGGNCMTVMIAHISPSSTLFEESRNTLVYAERTKRIKNKTRQNIVDVNYHVTEYKHMIDSLNLQVKTLQRELTRPHPLSHDPKVTALYQQLKTCSQEEKEMRKEVLFLEYHLLQNAVEYQKHLASTKEWEQRRLSMSNLPTSLSTIELSTTASSQEHKDTNTEEAHKPREMEISTEEQFSDAYVESSGPTSRNEQSEPLYSRPSSAEDNNVKSPVKSKSPLFLPPLRPNVVAVEEIITPPDSGPCTEVPAAEMEPEWVSRAREEMAVLMADKQRMEDEHHKLQKKHEQSMVKMTRVKQTISNYPGLQPSLKLMDILSQSCQSDASAVDHNVAASLMSIQLGHHESLIQQLLTHSSALLEVVGALHTAIGERSVALPEDVGSKVKELGDRQRELRAQVQAEQQMPLISRKMEIPYLAKMSAKLYSSVTGFKSNHLLVDESIPDDTDPVVSLSNAQILSTQPSLQSPIIDSLPILPSLSTLASMSQLIPSFLQLSSSSLVHHVRRLSLPISIETPLATSSLATDNKRNSIGVTKPLSDSSLHHILQAAKAKRNDGKASVVAINNIPPRLVLNRVVPLSNAASIPTRSTAKRKYTVHTSISRDGKGPSCGIQQSTTLRNKFSGTKLMMKKLPMDQLVTVMQSKRKSDVGVKEHTFRIPRTSRHKLKPMSTRKPSQPKITGSLSDESLTLLQSNKKLPQVSQPNNGRMYRKPLPLPTHKVLLGGKFTNSPYCSPVRAAIHNHHGLPNKSQENRKNAWK